MISFSIWLASVVTIILTNSNSPTWLVVVSEIGLCILLLASSIGEHIYRLRIARLEQNQDWLKNKIDEMEGKK